MTNPPCRRCGTSAPLSCLACTKPVCMSCAIPAPTSVTTLGDPTDANTYFCSYRCEDIYINIHRQ